MDFDQTKRNLERLRAWHDGGPHKILERWDPDRLASIDEQFASLQAYGAPANRELAICFLGSAGVGKSTLLNSLIDPILQVVPQGGIGPLTAQATVVRYSNRPYLRACYHGARRVNQLLFALDRLCERLRGATSNVDTALDENEQREVNLALPLGESVSSVDHTGEERSDESRMQSYLSQARLLVTGQQFGGDEVGEIEYLADCLRAAMGKPPHWGHAPRAQHTEFIAQVREGVAAGEAGKTWSQEADERSFLSQIARHATGSIAPLIKSLDVGWKCDLLKDGLVLVDLPGVGVANDEYRFVTSSWIRKASAVVLVVDRSGVMEVSADLLRSTGFLNSILHRPPDSKSVSPLLRVVAVRLDDVASAERTAFKSQNPGGKVPPWHQFFREACERIQGLIRDQLEQVFQQSISSAISETRSQRADAVQAVISQLQIHPVSAIEFRKVHAADSEDAAKIKDPADSNIPALMDSFQALARQHHAALMAEYSDLFHRLWDSIARGLERIHDEVYADERKLARVAVLRDSLDKAIKPAADEFLNRQGALRERLKGTIPQTIATQVERGVAAAERGIRDYFKGLHKLHWATLRGTIRRGGTWIRSRPVDLPNDLALRFEEPLAIAWNQAVVAPLGKTLNEFANDVKRLLERVVAWAGAAGGLDVAHVQSFQGDVQAEVSLLAIRGEKASAALTARAKQHLQAVIQEQIRTACQRFVDAGQDVGPGVKNRVIVFLEKLAPEVAAVARSTALRFLSESYDAVLSDVSGGFKRFDDPVARVKSLLLGDQTPAGDAQQRAVEGRQVKAFIDALESLREEISA